MVVLAACGPTATPKDAEADDSNLRIEERTSPTLNLEPPLIQAEDRGIEAIQIDEVWVFQHRPEYFWLASGGGTPEIVDGCLYIGDDMVVWDVDHIDQAAGAIAAVRAGKSPSLRFVGGVVSDTGIGFPTVITDRCATSSLWIIGAWSYARNAPAVGGRGEG